MAVQILCLSCRVTLEAEESPNWQLVPCFSCGNPVRMPVPVGTDPTPLVAAQPALAPPAAASHEPPSKPARPVVPTKPIAPVKPVASAPRLPLEEPIALPDEPRYKAAAHPEADVIPPDDDLHEVLPLDDDPPEVRPMRSKKPVRQTREVEDEGGGAKYTAIVILGYFFFVVIPIGGVIAMGVYFLGGSKPQPDSTPEIVQAPVVEKEPISKRNVPGLKRPPRSGKSNEKGELVPDTDHDPKPKPDGPSSTPPDGPGTPVTIAALEVAPPPRIVLPPPVAPEPRVATVLTPPEGFATEWEKVGVVEVRLGGVAVRTVPIVNSDMVNTDSPTPVLAIWVEVRTMATNKTIELRRWQGQSCSVTTDLGQELPRADLGPEATLRTGLPFKQPVLPGASPRVELLVFKPPLEGTREVTLTLDADRFGEKGKVQFIIPASAWKK